MAIDLRTVSITPLRQTFGHLSRRMGADKPASRYIEATMDLQPTENYHYRPTWEPQLDIFDTRRTQIRMKDWIASNRSSAPWRGTFFKVSFIRRYRSFASPYAAASFSSARAAYRSASTSRASREIFIASK